MRGLACTVGGLCLSRLAAAQPAAADAPRDYPLEITDRPILLLAGMTRLDVSEDFPTYPQTTTDAAGNAVHSRTGLFDRRTPALGLAHAFGPVEVAASLGELAGVSVGVNTGTIPGVVRLSAASAFLNSYQDPRYHFNVQSASVDHKVVVVPGRFAVFAAVGVDLVELSSTLDTGIVAAGHIVDVGAAGTAEVQLTRRLGVYGSVHAGAPVAQSSTQHAAFGLTPTTQLLFALRTWDFYASFDLVDVTHTPLPDLSIGFTKRWGI